MTDQYYLLEPESKWDYLTWWKPNGAGYTNRLESAGKYSLNEARRHLPHVLIIPCQIAENYAFKLVPSGVFLIMKVSAVCPQREEMANDHNKLADM